MSSPFTLFRRHEKILMVVVTGLSMISFVLLGAVNDPRNVPTPLAILFLAALAGGVAWLAGLSSGKGAEWGVSGVIVGALIGSLVAFYSREASAVLIDSGNLTSSDLSQLRRKRVIANRFVQQAFYQTFGMGLEGLPPQLRREYLFGFSSGEDIDINDIVLDELLRREATKMGITISDGVVWDYIKRVTSKKGLLDNLQRVAGQLDPQNRMILTYVLGQMKEKPFTAETFTKLRGQMQVSEVDLLDALRDELKSRQAFFLLYGQNYLPPEAFWEFYRQLHVRQSAEIASVPVDAFMDATAKPSEAELLELFSRYRETPPGLTPSGRPEEGRPGFMQPRRIRLGYLEATFDAIEPLVGEVTDEEIQKRYADRYLRTVPEGDKAQTPGLDALSLPPSLMPPKKETKPEEPADKKPGTETKPAEPGKPEEPAVPKSATPSPAAGEKSSPSTPPAQPEGNAKPATPESEQKQPPAEAKPQSSTIMTSGNLQLVAYLQDEEPAKKEAEKGSPPAEKPAAPSLPAPPAAKGEDKPASADKPAAPAEAAPDKPQPPAGKAVPPAPAEPEPAGKMPAGPAGTEAPPAPTKEVPELNDALKLELRDEILQEKTKAEIQKRIEQAYVFLAGLGEGILLDASEESHISLEAATKKIQAYAQEHQLEYVVTPMLSYEQLVDGEDYPIGRAVAAIGQQRETVADAMFQAPPGDLYRANRADNFVTNSSFAFWKLADKPRYVPQTLDDEPVVREQVTETWKRLQADPKAKARAEELAKMIRDSDGSMAETLSDVTVTGSPESLFMTARETGEFTWMQRSVVPPTSFMQPSTVHPSVIPGVSGVGESFYRAIFDDLQVGEVGVVPNEDRTVYYIVKIVSRNPGNEEELKQLRERFLAAGMEPTYGSLGQRTLSEYSVNWLDEFFRRHNVRIIQDE